MQMLLCEIAGELTIAGEKKYTLRAGKSPKFILG